MLDVVVLLLIGLCAGFLGGLLGVGGSVVMIPAMTLVFGPSQHLYQGAAMIVNLFVVLPAAIQHRRAGAILPPVVRVMIPTAIVGVLVGVWLSAGWWFAGQYEHYLSRVFGVFLLYVVGYNVYRLFGGQRRTDFTVDQAETIPSWKTAMVVGFPMGVVAGLLGIGGGSQAVPLQQVFLRLPLRQAIANSTATIIFVSAIGAAYKNYANCTAGISLSQALTYAGCLIPTAIVGGWIGGRLTHTISRRALRIAFICLMCYAAQHMIRRPAPIGNAQFLRPASGETLSSAFRTSTVANESADRVDGLRILWISPVWCSCMEAAA